MIDANSIFIGQRVVLNSGSPAMTVKAYSVTLNDDGLECTTTLVSWHDDDGILHEDKLPGATLTPLDRGEVKPMTTRFETAPHHKKTLAPEIEKTENG